MRTLPYLAAFAIFVTSQGVAVAGDDHKDSGWGVSIGLGGILAPSYLGDDDYQLSAVPNLRVTYEDKFFASIQEGIGYNVVNTKNWRAGPIAKYDFGRDEDGDKLFSVTGDDTNDLIGLGDVDGSLELGGFAEYTFKFIRSKVEVRHGIGGHEDVVAEAKIEFIGRTEIFDQQLMYSAGPRIGYMGENYAETYFGVNAAQSAASGLAQYNTDAGLLTYGVGASLIVPITENVSTLMFANYTQLGDEAADSSLVQQRGSEHQTMVGIFLNYTF